MVPAADGTVARINTPKCRTFAHGKGLASVAILLGCSPVVSPLTLANEWSPKAVRFSGLTWDVRHGAEATGPGRNLWGDGPPNVAIDGDGRLHLSVAQAGSEWRSAEVRTPLPSGPCRIDVWLSSALPRSVGNVVVGIFAYSSDTNELDFEASNWGRASGPDGLFTVVPAVVPGHQHAFVLGPGSSSRIAFEWSPGRVAFRFDSGQQSERWTYRGQDAPRPDGHHLHINVWLRGEPPLSPVTVTIERVRIEEL
jgi:hypothetical protein